MKDTLETIGGILIVLLFVLFLFMIWCGDETRGFLSKIVLTDAILITAFVIAHRSLEE